MVCIWRANTLETNSALADHQLQHDFVDDELEQSVKRRLSYKDKGFQMLGVSPVARDMSLISAAGNLNITAGGTTALAEINKVSRSG